MTTLEKAARALYEQSAKPRSGVDPRDPWDRLDPRFQAYWFESARAVLEAIREPDEGMLDAADEPIHDELRKQHAFSMEHYSKPAFASSPFSERAWQAMIDHILSEKEKT